MKHGTKRRLTFFVVTIAIVLLLFTAGCGVPAADNLEDGTVSAPGSITPDAPDSALAKVFTSEQPEESPSENAETFRTPEIADSVQPANSPASVPGNSAELSPSVATSNEPQEPALPPKNSSFAVHFIDVGQADAALILCDGHAMLIDGGNAEDSNLIYAYLKKLSLNYLDYIVCTHAHEDHVGGLSGALNYATVGTVLSPVTSYDSRAFGSFVNNLAKQNIPITVPSAGDAFYLGSASVSVLGPITQSADTNNTSIVLRIVYGDTSFLFTGDAEREEEQDILSAGYDLDSTVLKVGHHGSETSTSYVWLREIMPEYAVISVGKGNSYGHPTEAVLSRLRDADVKTYRTDMQGDVICTSDGKTVSFSVDRNADVDTLAEAGAGGKGDPGQTGNGGGEKPNEGSAPSSQPQPSAPPSPTPSVAPAPTPTPEIVAPVPVGTDYILNTNTHKFHYPNCGSVKQMSEKNKQAYTGNREDVIAMGYVPCKKCKP